MGHTLAEDAQTEEDKFLIDSKVRYGKNLAGKLDVRVCGKKAGRRCRLLTGKDWFID